MIAPESDPPAAAPRSEPPRPRAVAIVVGFNSARDLPACLEALEAQRDVDLEIHVVDNASTDGSVELVRSRFPRVRLLRNDRNAGFAGANNQILEHVDAPFYALVNPDAVLPPGAIAACLAQFARDGTAGIVGSRLVNPDGSLQRSCFGFLGLANLLGETLAIHRIAPALRPLTSFYMPWFRHDRIADVDWIQGAFLVVRGEVVRAVGAFDPDFFMYGEEMEWCRRIRDAGWRVVFLPEPPVVHAGGTSSAPIAGPMFVENLKGRLRYLRKHRGPGTVATARILMAISVIARAAWREGAAVARRLAGRSLDEAEIRRRTMFRAALGWVARGLPLGEFDAGAAAG
jgi:GT2 family glycosyltransferase